jgi:hypothetical protein
MILADAQRARSAAPPAAFILSDEAPRLPIDPCPLTASQTRAECERIWNRPGVAYAHRKAGWRFAELASEGGRVSVRLAPSPGAPLRWLSRLRHPGAYLLRRLRGW